MDRGGKRVSLKEFIRDTGQHTKRNHLKCKQKVEWAKMTSHTTRKKKNRRKSNGQA